MIILEHNLLLFHFLFECKVVIMCLNVSVFKVADKIRCRDNVDKFTSATLEGADVERSSEGLLSVCNVSLLAFLSSVSCSETYCQVYCIKLSLVKTFLNIVCKFIINLNA